MNTLDFSIKNGKELSGISGLPDNIAQYFNDHFCAIEISVCHTDVECGYGSRISKAFKILRPFCKCNRCSFHSLWNPDDSDSKCLRHTYTKGWDVVFSYTLDTGEHKMSLDAAFDEFLKLQPRSEFLPVIPYHN